MIRRVKTIDAHAAGQPLRLVVDGFPTPRGRTMPEKAEWASNRLDHLRRALMLEPRGHADMCGAVLTEPVTPGSHAGVLFMHNDGFGEMSGHGIIAVTTIALGRGLLLPGGEGTSVVYDTVAGVVRATATLEARVKSVVFTNVPAFVLYGGLPIKPGHREARADVAFGGAFYAIVDSEAVGLRIDAAQLPELRRAAADIKRAVEQDHVIAHPLEASLRGISGTIFTGPPNSPSADLRNVTIFADGQVDRSPCGTGTAAVMAVVDAMGLLAEDRPFVHESILGGELKGHVAGRTTVADRPAIVTSIAGEAWITGEHDFLIDDDDPLKDGFRI